MAPDGEILGGSQSLQAFVYGNPGIGYLTQSIKEMSLVPNFSEAVFIPTGYYEIKVIILLSAGRHKNPFDFSIDIVFFRTFEIQFKSKITKC